MITRLQKQILTASACEVRFNDLTRQLYATDASIYQVEPIGVAFPKSPAETAAVIRAAVEGGIDIIPRGAGTGLAGGALGSGLIVDFSRYNRNISDFDRERGTVRVEAGVVLDQLNTILKPHGFCFGPDVATSSRATLGGMIANNSSGARAPRYGTTIDHVESLEIVLADGTHARVGRNHTSLPHIQKAVAQIAESLRDVIDEHCPEGLVKRWPGYGFDRWLRDNADLTRILGASEGTLAAIVSAELRVSPLPEQKGLGVVFFETVPEAMQATVELLEIGPVAIEHIDRLCFDQTKGQRAFRRAREVLELDGKPCGALLLVEFYEDVEERLARLEQTPIGLRRAVFTDHADMEQVWGLRKAGLTLLTSRAGAAKPYSGIEDVAVLPSVLPEYVRALREAMSRLGLEGSFYGHAASGLLHVRPVVDLHRADDIARFRAIADEVSAIVKQFKGSIAAEHGVGIARTEYLPDHLGPELMEAHKQVKALFDPKGLLNPGKIVPDGRYRFDTNLRQGEGSTIELPFKPALAYAFRDHSFLGNLEQCNGNGACRKLPPVMCPTYRATGEECYSTRGYANTIRAVLESRLGDGEDPLSAPELDHVLGNCLACKACRTECPSNVNMALLKSELLHARQERHGAPLRTRVFSRVDLLGAFASITPRLANATLAAAPVRWAMEKVLGIASRRPLPRYAREPFHRWFERNNGHHAETRGQVILWDDCFVRYNEPNIGIAAKAVLEAAGYQVVLAAGRACCGRPAFSLGCLDTAKSFAEHNLKQFTSDALLAPIVFLEPSCYSMFTEDYHELAVDGADELAQRSHLFEDFIADLLTREPDALRFKSSNGEVAVHSHCHAKALTDAGDRARFLAERTGGATKVLNTGCCGMAGAFGAMAEKYDMSIRVGEELIEQLKSLESGTTIVASGTSCRHQIEHLHHVTPLHMAEYLAAALESDA